jgi:hypothetical protein
MTREERAMIDLIRELALFLSRDRLTVDAVTAWVGRVVRDPGIPMPIELQTTLPGVRSAKLGRYPDSGLPYVLTLEPAQDSRPSVGALKAALGNYRQARTSLGAPAVLVFPAASTGRRWEVAVIATVDKGAKDLDSTRVRALTLRRDPLTR